MTQDTLAQTDTGGVKGLATGLWRRVRRERGPVVPVIRLAGVIGGGGGIVPGRAALSDKALAPIIERAFATKGAKAVALAVNSPGGSPVQSALIAARIRRAAEDKKLPVIAFVEDVGASGGYWLACAADEIHAHACSLVGSIGVISAGFGFVEAIRRLGVERRVYTAGTEKSMLDPFMPEDGEDVGRLKAIQAEIHAAFKDLVRERRGARLRADEDTLFNGQVHTGTKALALGLIDGLGDLQGILRERYGAKVKTPVMGVRRSFLARRLRPAADAEAAGAALAGLVGYVEERALWARYGL